MLISSTICEQFELDSIVEDISRLFMHSAYTAYGDTSVSYDVNCDRNKKKYSKDKPRSKPWYDNECEAARQDFTRVKNVYNRSKTQANRECMRIKGKRYKRVNHIHYRRHVTENANKINRLKRSNPKKFWRYIVDKKKSTPEVSKDAFYEFMKNLNMRNEEEDSSPPTEFMVDNAISEQLNVPISEAEIKSNTLKLVNGKSSGLDSILNEHIKSTLHLMIPIYLKLFNIVLDTGIVPRAWTEGCIIPIFKNKGCKENPANYRPITLLSCMGKLFTAIINSRLQIFSTEFNIIQQNQSGFRKNYSTMDNVFVLQALFDILASKKKKMYCAFIDFQRAFDTVWRAGLWKKLIDSNIKGKCFNVIYSMYQGIKSCVSVNGELSTFFQCSTGVRQGENISPFLFSIYLNDLEDHLRFDHINGIKLVLHTDEVFLFLKIFVLLYADNTALLAESREDLQTALDSFEQYCRMWKLTVNIEKTKIIVFGRGKMKSDLAFHLNNQNIEIVKHFKYLGVIFSRGGSFQASIKHNCEQAAKAMFLLIRKMKTLDLSVDTQIELFDKMIKPILLYGSEIWGYSNVKPIERIHVKFLKSIFNRKQSTPNVMLYGEFGVYPIEIDIKVRLISFWSKVAETDSLKY